ncbi:hypothetical protein VPH35_101517 [Triticum aestivum]
MADGDNNIGGLLPTDVLIEVLLRLPTSSRRRFRLACRLWRDIIDTHTTEMQSRPKMLVATVDAIHLVEEDDLPSSRWTGADYDYDGMSLVGTCNGLVCMYDSQDPDGPIILANPVTGEMLAITPPPPMRHTKATSDSRLTFTFTYHPTTGRYKVMHVPYSFDRVWVFTLGEALWRDVATGSPTEIYDVSKGMISIDGTVYWAVKGGEAKVVSFDLDSEHVASVRPLPKVLSRHGSWHLVEARGRLGVAFSRGWWTADKTEVWVMEHAMAGRRRTWSRWYNIIMEKPVDQLAHQHQLTLPSFTTHDSEYILTMRWEWDLLLELGRYHGYVLYKHKPSNDVKKQARHGVVEIGERDRGAEVAVIPTHHIRPRTFAYVETTEPLSVYRCR